MDNLNAIAEACDAAVLDSNEQDEKISSDSMQKNLRKPAVTQEICSHEEADKLGCEPKLTC